MIVIALSGWALLGGAVLSLVAAETWALVRRAASSRRPRTARRPASGPTARDLAALAAVPSPEDAESELGELVCLRCDRPVDYDARLGLFCPSCKPAEAALDTWQTVGLRCGPAGHRSPSRALKTAVVFAGVGADGSSAQESPMLPVPVPMPPTLSETGIPLPPGRFSPDVAGFEDLPDGIPGPI